MNKVYAGGYEEPIQQVIIQPTPPPDTGTPVYLWATGVVVPVLIALIGLWAVRRKKQ